MTVIICTYQRPELLEISLSTLQLQTLSKDKFRVFVVDNAGQPSVAHIAERFGASYYHAPVVGHSGARNFGWITARTEWILYLDDDIKAPPDLLERFYHRMLLPEVDVLGGRYVHWYRVPPPAWLHRYYGEGREPCGMAEWGELPEDAMLSGNILAARRTVLQSVGGFRTDKGMIGMQVGWGDDDHFQIDARAKGYRIFYDPDLWIHHLVQPYKYTIAANLRMAYAMGRDVGKYGDRGRIGTLRLAFLGLRAICVTFPHTVLYALTDRAYTWQNMAVDVGSKLTYAWGRFLPNR